MTVPTRTATMPTRSFAQATHMRMATLLLGVGMVYSPACGNTHNDINATAANRSTTAQRQRGLERGLVVGAFNIQVFGQSKMNKDGVGSLCLPILRLV